MNDSPLHTSILNNGATIFALFATDDSYRTIEYLADGEENYIYKFSGQKAQYVVRVLKPGNTRTQADYRFEFEFQDYLRAHDIPTPRQYKTKAGGFYATHVLNGDTLQLTLHDFVAGDLVSTPNAEQVEAAAELLGKLHSLAHGFNPSYDRLEHLDTLAWLDDTVDEPRADASAEKAYALYAKYGQLIKNNLLGLIKSPLHNDVDFGNLLFKGNELAAILDFDESHKHYIPLELGWSMGQICNFGGPREFENNLVVFQKAYGSKYQLSALENSVATAALIAETSRKLLKYPSDLDSVSCFNNIVKWEHGLSSNGTLTAITDEKS